MILFPFSRTTVYTKLSWEELEEKLKFESRMLNKPYAVQLGNKSFKLYNKFWTPSASSFTLVPYLRATYVTNSTSRNAVEVSVSLFINAVIMYLLPLCICIYSIYDALVTNKWSNILFPLFFMSVMYAIVIVFYNKSHNQYMKYIDKLVA